MRSDDRARAPGAQLAALGLGALGVVYGDIGTSPLYTLTECFRGVHPVAPTPENILGVISLVFWALMFVVTFKYLVFVMRADNRGEGGIIALLALLRPRGTARGKAWVVVGLALFGAALLYGDGVITPAITVLGAVEGLSVVTPAFTHLVVPVSVVILAGLFWLQKRGTMTIGSLFGPVMFLWFVAIALLGIRGILMHPGVLVALDPRQAIELFGRDGTAGFLVLGGVVLAVTGAEALYADMGHFGRGPIRANWFALVLPALVLNYFGQGANLLVHPDALRNPFYALVPESVLWPMIVLATLAAIVASQALISGAFSLTRQAVQLGYSPRVTIVHTSSTEIGQIYIPEVNTALGVTCVALVLGFRSSPALAAAYGIAVTGTMMITSILFHQVAVRRWHWPEWQASLLTAVFLVVDLAFFGANIVKIEDGGWFPIAVAAVVFTMMTTWKRGRDILGRISRDNSLPITLFLDDIRRRRPVRVPGTAVFMSSDPSGAPPVLLHHLKHNKVLHERVILVSVLNQEIPQVPETERVEFEDLGEGFFQVRARYGFMETPNVPDLLKSLERREDSDAMGLGGIVVKPLDTTFYLGRETLLPTGPSRLARWRKRLFIVMARNAVPAWRFFALPANRVVEMGAQIQL